ncbi:hypothetical protein OSB04_028972 [Centaurea solstitialis]|uniref:SWIM-type domain-containing protein n=1 Tax=Centaurea solstitialis TaxID=347529 RepID=A0AA38WBQ6_9ASTR|nr:hypothetical protein OSB04_028972 [Centaurea solstitialis]
MTGPCQRSCDRNQLQDSLAWCCHHMTSPCQRSCEEPCTGFSCSVLSLHDRIGNVFSHQPQHFPSQQYPHQSQQFASQQFPQTHQPTFPEQLQDDFLCEDGHENIPDLNETPLNDDADVTNDEEDWIRNDFWGEKFDKERYEAVCVNDGCEWRLMASVVENGHVMLQVWIFHDVHTCSRTQLQANNRNATPQVLGHILKEELRDCKRVYRPHDIRSFREGLRLLLIMDGAHLKGDYVGSMFLAVGMNANNQICPIAMGVGKSESGQAWTWFLRRLRGCIGEPANLTFVTDRAPAIELAHHGLCARHLVATMDLIRHSLPNAASYLEEVGYPRWARSLFPGLRYSSMTSNIAESINSITRFIHYIPNTMLVEYYRSTLQDWYFKRGIIAEQHPLIIWAQPKIGKRIRKSANWRVYGISETEFEVHEVDKTAKVDLREQTCPCMQWRISSILCGHLIVAVQSLNHTDCYQWASSYFTSNAYRRTWGYQVKPLPAPSEYEFPPEQMKVFLPTKNTEILEDHVTAIVSHQKMRNQ